MNITVWLGFLVAAILIAVSPGPGAAVSMSVGLRYGYASALRSIAGLQVGLLTHVLIVGVGLGALLAHSATGFLVLKVLGATYLAWLGVQKWRAAPLVDSAEATVPSAPRGLFLQGLLVNLTNPKAIVFMVALMPQFIDPTRSQGLQFGVVGLTLSGVDIVVMSCYALLATRLRRWLNDARAQKMQNRLFGGVFVGAGLLLAVSSQH